MKVGSRAAVWQRGKAMESAGACAQHWTLSLAVAAAAAFAFFPCQRAPEHARARRDG